ncbi:MAG: 30S ribosomal protein S8 [Gemmataceae bacterium]|nr:30S ribosomal protein S8 [Gemmataceae bacterium]MCI0739628.1 30S ribosomal protein S8 [Gemmataceae bacterium]
MMTDPIADMLTRIRNGNRIEAPAVDMPSTHTKERLAQVLKDEGFILDFQVGKIVDEGGQKKLHSPADEKEPKKVLRVFLKYGPEGEKVIRIIERVSTPGLRIYRSYKQLSPVLDGLGIAVLSTSKGIMSDRQARAQRLGGEILCKVW